MRVVTLSCGAAVVQSGDQTWLFGAPEGVAESLKEAGLEPPKIVMLTSMRSPGLTALADSSVRFKEQPLHIGELSATPIKHKHGTDYKVEDGSATLIFSERGDVAVKDIEGADFVLIRNKHRADDWGDNVMTWPWADAEFDITDHSVQRIDSMTAKEWKSMDDVPENLKTLKGTPLTLEQANWMARVAIGSGEKGKENWAIAKAQFQKSYEQKDGEWVLREKSLESDLQQFRRLWMKQFPPSEGQEEVDICDVDPENSIAYVCEEGVFFGVPYTGTLAGNDVIFATRERWFDAEKTWARVAPVEAEGSTMKETVKNSDGRTADDFLVVGHDKKPSTWQLPIGKAGKPDTKLMGAASAALTVGYRGNKYEGPDKDKAVKKLVALYKKLELDIPENLAKAAGVSTKEFTSEGPVRRLGDAFIATLHTAYNNFADTYYSQGYMNQEERLLLGKAIGDGLDAVRKAMPQELQDRPLDDLAAALKSLQGDLQAFRAALTEQFPHKDNQTWMYLNDVDVAAGIAYVNEGDINYGVPFTYDATGKLAYAAKPQWFPAMQYWGPAPMAMQAVAVPMQMKELAPGMPDEIVGTWHTVYKDSEGQRRWAAITSTAVWDKHDELVPQEAMDWAIALGRVTGPGPLRFKHVPGLDGGDCDSQIAVGGFLFEGGTFRDTPLGWAMWNLMSNDPTWQISPGLAFSHKDLTDGVYSRCAIFERSMTKIPANPVTSILNAGGNGMATLKQLSEVELKQVAGELKLDVDTVRALHKQALENGTPFGTLKEFSDFVAKQADEAAAGDEEEVAGDEEEAGNEERVKEILSGLDATQRKELREALDDVDAGPVGRLEGQVTALKEMVEQTNAAVSQLAQAVISITTKEQRTDPSAAAQIDEILSMLPRRQAAKFASQRRTKEAEGEQATVDQQILATLKQVQEEVKDLRQHNADPMESLYAMATSKTLNAESK